MQHLILSCLIAGSNFLVVGAAASIVSAVPVPPKTTAKLPTPHSHLGAAEPISCQRLEACLAEAGPEDNEKSKLKACIQSFCQDLESRNVLNVTESRQALCNEKGKKVWDILSKANKSGKKASLVALKSNNPVAYGAILQALVAQSSTLVHVADACRLQTKGTRSTFLSRDAPQQVAVMKTAAPHAPVPHMPVPPAKPPVELPKPHSPPGLKVSQSGEAPKSCKKLDVCLTAADHGDLKKSATDFKACIQSFCEDAYKGEDLNKPDSRTVLCDKKGKESWDIISKARTVLKAGKKMSLVAMRSYRPDTYAAVLHAIFAQSSTVHQTKACEVSR